MKPLLRFLLVALLSSYTVNAQPAASPALDRKAKALGLVYKEAVAQPEGSRERRQLYTEFLRDSEALLKEVPNATNIWVLRAAIGLEVNDAVLAWQAGQRLVALGADKNPDSSIQDMLVQLERRKWLSVDAIWENSLGMIFVPVPGTRVRFCIWETRVGDYAGFAKATGLNWKPKEGQNSQYPAGRISWDNAKAFCQWLTAKEKAEGTLGPQQLYRLPTDAEWSLAVGLGSEQGNSPSDKDKMVKDVYPWGTQWPPPPDAGHFSASAGKFIADTTLVGSYPANRFGLFDLAGNAHEWCEDLYGGNGEKSNYHVQRDTIILQNILEDNNRIFLLSSSRGAFPSDKTLLSFFGFRVVLAVSTSP